MCFTKAIEKLCHSATVYKAAKSRLEQKYIWNQRKVALHFEKMKPLRHGVAKGEEKFADVLDVAVINLKEGRWHQELRNEAQLLSQ